MSNKIVSLANSLILILISLIMSLIKIKDRNGPKMDPCGTLALILCHVDL